MRFANPHFLWLLLALPALVGLLALRGWRRRRLLARFAEASLHPYLAPNFSPHLYRIKQMLLVAAAALLIIGGARPQWGYEERRIVSRGIDLLIAVDVSQSMLAQDYKPNRLARAKDLLQNILWELKGDRVGIIAFAGEAVIQCPLTIDYGMAKAALDTLDTNAVATPGTNIGAAIDAAIRAFDTAASGERVLILLTDGEDHEGQGVTMAEKAKAHKIRIHTIGIGTSEGMPIPVEGGSYKQDKEGRLVATKLDFATLSKIAEITGGQAIKANPEGIAELVPILSDIEKTVKTQQQDTVFRVYTERFAWFVIPALLLLCIEALMQCYVRREIPWRGSVLEQ